MKLSFVIVEYYSMKELDSCIASIKQNIFKYDYEIIISSNSMYPINKQRELVQDYFQYKWCFNPLNGGFAYAMNRGLEISTGDIMIMLNPDTRIHYGLEVMADYLSLNSNIGIIAPRIINDNGLVQDSFREFITPWNFFQRHAKRLLGLYPKVKDDVQDPIIVDWVIGAFIMMTKNVFNITRGLDEKFFLYCEDMDFCRSVKKKGYDIVYFPQMEIIYEGTRSARRSLKYALIFYKSLLYYWSKPNM